jgi:antitoxin component YwqK of YwqJK toxin-antitoxin module
MCLRLSLTILLVVFHQSISSGQNSPPKFYEIIENDSVMFFFNGRNMFVEKACADFVRYSRIDKDGFFHGYFDDLSIDNVLLGKGHYVHGRKHGYFEVHYPDGSMRCKGNYADDKPIGQWEYFYEDELPERTLKITDSDTLLIRFADKKGNVKVMDGNGEFNGPIAVSQTPTNVVNAKGKIENGKPNGKWTSILVNNIVYCKEEFENGKFVRGTFPNAIAGSKKYEHKSFLSKFMLGTYLYDLEVFRIEKCADSVMYSRPKYNFDIQKFNADLRLEIDRVIESDFRTGNTEQYQIGDNYLTIQFSINKEGRPEDLRLLSGWGQQFFHAISSSIKMRTKFPPNAKTMYFQLKLNFPGGASYQYRFRFSTESTFK